MALKNDRRSCAAVVLTMLVVLVMGGDAVAQEPDAATQLTLKLEGECDKQNKRLWLVNGHGSRTILATLRWRVAGSSRTLIEQFEVRPMQTQEVGCASEAELVVAQYGS